MITASSANVNLAWAKLERLRQAFGADCKMFKKVTKQTLIDSPTLRTFILDYDMTHFLNAEKVPMSFERKFDSEYDEFTAAQASFLQSDVR